MRIDQGKTVNPGLFRHQIRWQRKTVIGQDSYGQDILGPYAELARSRVQVNELAGRELESAQQRWAEVKFEILQHFVAGLKPSDRGVWFLRGVTRYLDIVGVPDPVGTGLYQVIYAKDWVA